VPAPASNRPAARLPPLRHILSRETRALCQNGVDIRTTSFQGVQIEEAGVCKGEHANAATLPTTKMPAYVANTVP